jgi:D-glycero-alpha-D-manno-heptose-7-phosphate kinase
VAFLVIYRSRAPMRIDLAGGWTDVSPYAGQCGGAVVNVAIALYAHVTIRPGGREVRLSAPDLGASVTARRAEDLRADGELALLKAAVRRHAPEGGLEIMISSDAPPGSGLGGSGALGVALVAALYALSGTRRMPAEIAAAAFETETQEAGVIGGKQDQYAAALGGVQFLAFGDPEVSAARLDVPWASLRELEHHLVLCYTGVSRVSSETHHRVWQDFARGEARVRTALDGLRSCAHAMRVALERGDTGHVGAILNENWRLQQQLADGMRTDAMARLERVALEAGAEGMKACGAGAGGCEVFLARPGREYELAAALRAAGGTVLRFTFDTTGVAAWESGER